MENKNLNNNGKDVKQNSYQRKYKLFRKKYCKFCSEGIVWIDYKNVERLEQYVTDKGKIMSAKITGNCAKHQRQVATAIKVMRNLALMPYTATNYRPRILDRNFNQKQDKSEILGVDTSIPNSIKSNK